MVRKTPIFATFVAAAAAMGALTTPTPAHACSCIGLSAEQAFANADAVFEGRVVAVGPSQFAGQPCGGFCPQVLVRLRVVRTWKGADAEEVEVYTEDGGASCGTDFEAATSWLVYARDTPDERLVTGLCSGTVRVEEAGEAIQALGAGVTPVDPGPEPDPADDPGADQDAGADEGVEAEESTPGRAAAPGSGGCASCAVLRAEPLTPGALALLAGLVFAVAARRRG